jgi:hypothetical protein
MENGMATRRWISKAEASRRLDATLACVDRLIVDGDIRTRDLKHSRATVCAGDVEKLVKSFGEPSAPKSAK